MKASLKWRTILLKREWARRSRGGDGGIATQEKHIHFSSVQLEVKRRKSIPNKYSVSFSASSFSFSFHYIISLLNWERGSERALKWKKASKQLKYYYTHSIRRIESSHEKFFCFFLLLAEFEFTELSRKNYVHILHVHTQYTSFTYMMMFINLSCSPFSFVAFFFLQFSFFVRSILYISFNFYTKLNWKFSFEK